MTHVATLLNTPLVVFDSRDEPLCSSDGGAEEGNSSECAPAKQPEEAKARHCRLHGRGPRLRVSKGIAQRHACKLVSDLGSQSFCAFCDSFPMYLQFLKKDLHSFVRFLVHINAKKYITCLMTKSKASRQRPRICRHEINRLSHTEASGACVTAHRLLKYEALIGQFIQ